MTYSRTRSRSDAYRGTGSRVEKRRAAEKWQRVVRAPKDKPLITVRIMHASAHSAHINGARQATRNIRANDMKRHENLPPTRDPFLRDASESTSAPADWVAASRAADWSSTGQT